MHNTINSFSHCKIHILSYCDCIINQVLQLIQCFCKMTQNVHPLNTWALKFFWWHVINIEMKNIFEKNKFEKIGFVSYCCKSSGPRHTTNPSHLRKFWVQKVTHKKLLNFSEKIHRYFKTILHLCPKHLRRHCP